MKRSHDCSQDTHFLQHVYHKRKDDLNHSDSVSVIFTHVKHPFQDDNNEYFLHRIASGRCDLFGVAQRVCVENIDVHVDTEATLSFSVFLGAGGHSS